ncbi:MAG: hypothetical protein LUD47_07475 [Clostridia bacterium]|nr:hypothetical protein [Clostridia bacterium]
MSNEQLFMIEYTVADMVKYLMEDYGVDMVRALEIVYSSRTFRQLKNVDTGLYVEEGPYVYELLKAEPDFTSRVKGE